MCTWKTGCCWLHKITQHWCKVTHNHRWVLIITTNFFPPTNPKCCLIARKRETVAAASHTHNYTNRMKLCQLLQEGPFFFCDTKRSRRLLPLYCCTKWNAIILKFSFLESLLYAYKSVTSVWKRITKRNIGLTPLSELWRRSERWADALFTFAPTLVCIRVTLFK